jgi:hypothetical protein
VKRSPDRFTTPTEGLKRRHQSSVIRRVKRSAVKNVFVQRMAIKSRSRD